MSNQGKFLVFCAEQYKLAKKINGQQLVALFDKYGIWEYIYSCYEALHTTGSQYIITDIDSYIAARQ